MSWGTVRPKLRLDSDASDASDASTAVPLGSVVSPTSSASSSSPNAAVLRRRPGGTGFQPERTASQTDTSEVATAVPPPIPATAAAAGLAVAHAGWVWKRSRFLGVFRKRFCVLTDEGILHFLSDPAAVSVTDSVDLRQSRSKLVEGDSLVDGAARDLHSARWKHMLGRDEGVAFMLHVRPRVPTFADFRYIRDLTLVVCTFQDRKLWLRAFASLGPSLLELVRSSDAPLAGEASKASSFCGSSDGGAVEETVCAICLEAFATSAPTTLADDWPAINKATVEKQERSADSAADAVVGPGVDSVVVLTGLAEVAPNSEVVSGAGADALPAACAATTPSAVDKDIFRLSCGHTFCTDCIHRWAAVNRFCPECRALF